MLWFIFNFNPRFYFERRGPTAGSGEQVEREVAGGVEPDTTEAGVEVVGSGEPDSEIAKSAANFESPSEIVGPGDEVVASPETGVEGANAINAGPEADGEQPEGNLIRISFGEDGKLILSTGSGSPIQPPGAGLSPEQRAMNFILAENGLWFPGIDKYTKYLECEDAVNKILSAPEDDPNLLAAWKRLLETNPGLVNHLAQAGLVSEVDGEKPLQPPEILKQFLQRIKELNPDDPATVLVAFALATQYEKYEESQLPLGLEEGVKDGLNLTMEAGAEEQMEAGAENPTGEKMRAVANHQGGLQRVIEWLRERKNMAAVGLSAVAVSLLISFFLQPQKSLVHAEGTKQVVIESPTPGQGGPGNPSPTPEQPPTATPASPTPEQPPTATPPVIASPTPNWDGPGNPTATPEQPPTATPQNTPTASPTPPPPETETPEPKTPTPPPETETPEPKTPTPPPETETPEPKTPTPPPETETPEPKQPPTARTVVIQIPTLPPTAQATVRPAETSGFVDREDYKGIDPNTMAALIGIILVALAVSGVNVYVRRRRIKR